MNGYNIRTVYPQWQTQQPLIVKHLFDHTPATIPTPPLSRGDPLLSNLTADTRSFHTNNSAEELRNTGHEYQNGLIPKPPGQAGCLSRGGYSLERSLNWNRVELSSVQVG